MIDPQKTQKQEQKEPLIPQPQNIELQIDAESKSSVQEKDKIFVNGLDQSPVEIKPQKKIKTIDKLFESIGYSKFQYVQIFIAALVNIVIGVESLIPNLIVVQIQKEMKVELYVAAMLVAAFGLGAGVGSYISGYLADNFGRRKIMLYSLGVITGVGILSSFINEFYLFLVMRFIVCTTIGVIKMIACSFLIEWLPKKNRSLVMSFTQIYSVGNIIINAAALLCIENNELIHWRWLIRSSCLLSFFAFILLIFSYESPKFLLSRMMFKEGLIVLEKLGKNANIILTEADKEKIKEEIAKEEAHHVDTSIKEMFKGIFLKTSLLLLGIKIMSSFINAGNLYILPFLLGTTADKHRDPSKNSSFNQYDAICGYFLSNLIAVPSPILRGILSEIKYLGRKYTLFISCILGTLGIILAIIFFSSLSYTSGFARMAFTATTALLNVYTVEIFPTKIRTLSLGFINASTRIGPILAPFICAYLEQIQFLGSFYFFGLLGILCGVLTLLLPIETRGINLDDLNTLRGNNQKNVEPSEEDQRFMVRSDSSSSLEVAIAKAKF